MNHNKLILVILFFATYSFTSLGNLGEPRDINDMRLQENVDNFFVGGASKKVKDSAKKAKDKASGGIDTVKKWVKKLLESYF